MPSFSSQQNLLNKNSLEIKENKLSLNPKNSFYTCENFIVFQTIVFHIITVNILHVYIHTFFRPVDFNNLCKPGDRQQRKSWLTRSIKRKSCLKTSMAQ